MHHDGAPTARGAAPPAAADALTGDANTRRVEIAPGILQDASVRSDVAFKGAGGGIDGRGRFPLEVARAVLDAVGKDMAVIAKYSMTDAIAAGSTIEDGMRFAQLLEGAGSLLFNDTTRKYEGRDYEKVMLNLGLALNHLTLNDWDSARIEIKKMHERQALIAEYQSKKLEQAKADAEEKQLKVTSFKELGGYPIETLEDRKSVV